ncbi:MAG: Ig-like domain-containing protein [Planctomycetales bacterium]|nr:Ig-like domain-containing protein [Planctomycetales bacterium]
MEGVHGRIFEEGFVPPEPHIHVEPIGDQWLVGEASSLAQSFPAVGVFESTGNYVAAWTSFEQADGDTSGLGVYAQLYAPDGTPLVDPFLVNTGYTTDDQTNPTVAVAADGTFLVAWQSQGEDGDGDGIFAQRYLADGTPNGIAFQVNTESAGDQSLPTAAMDNAGNAIIAWQSEDQDTDGSGIYARRYDAAGAALDADDVLVNTTVAGNQTDPSVSRDRVGGDYVIAWQSETLGEEGEVDLNVLAHVFDASGATVVSEFVANSILEKDQVGPSAAMSPSGEFVIAWTSEGQVGSGADVYARQFDAAGDPVADDFLVNETTLRGQQYPATGIDADGNILVSWQSSHQDGFSWGVYAKAYDATGAVIEPEFQVNTNTQGPQVNPALNANSDGEAIVVWLGLDVTHAPAVHAKRIQLPQGAAEFEIGPEGEVVLANYAALEEAPASATVDGDGNYIVVWQSYGDDGSGLGIYGRRFDATGSPLEDPFLVNTTTAGNQSHPDVAADLLGNFVVVWQSIDQDGDGYGIFGQRFDVNAMPVGGEFQINSAATGHQEKPVVAVDPDGGNSIVVWQGPDADGTGIYSQRYDVDWNPIGGEQAVNHFTDLAQVSATVSMNTSGEYVIGWVSDHRAVFDPIDTEKSIFVQWYDAAGNAAAADEVLIHQILEGLEAQENPDVAMDESGNFLVVWQSINQDGNTWGVFARQFLSDLTPVQNEFQVNQTVLAPQRHAGTAVDADGNFVVAWQSHAQDASGPGVFARVYDSAAVAQTDEFLVPTWDDGPQTWPVVAMVDISQFGIFWTGHGVDRVEGVHGRAFGAPLSTLNFDFGTISSPVASDYTQVTHVTMYTPELGYGWAAGSIGSRDRVTGTDLSRDFNFGRDGTFVADVANGDYEVTLLIGDATVAHDNVGIYLEGTQVDTVTTAAGEIITRVYVVTVADDQLTLRLDDQGGSDVNAVINALDIDPLPDTSGPRVVSSQVVGAFDRISGFRLTFSEPINAATFSPADIVELTGPGGAITGAHITEVSDAEFLVTFDEETTLGEYTLTIGPDIRDLLGNPMDQDQDHTSGEDPDDRFTTTVSVVDALRYDFGTPTSPVEAGYQRVHEAMTYTAELGYGWLAGAIYSRDRGVGTDLTRDFNFSTNATFGADVSPGTYMLTVTVGDASSAHDNIGLYAEETLLDTVSTARGEVLTLTYEVAVSDGQLTFAIRDLGGSDRYALVNGLEVSTTMDVEGPQVVSSVPSGLVLGTVDQVRLTFNEPIDPTTFTTPDVIELVGPSGPLTLMGVHTVSPTTFDVRFASQSDFGEYQLVIGPNIEDTSGNLMNQNDNATNGEDPEDRYTTSFTITDGRRFDFGTATSPVEPGYTGVTPAMTYTPTVGYGWLSGSIAARDRTTGTDLTRDFNFTRLGTFVADVDNGDYTVTVLLGDMRYPHDNMGVFLEGAQVDVVTTAAGEVVTRMYDVSVADGQLTLLLDDLGGSDANVTLVGMEYHLLAAAEDLQGPSVVSVTPEGVVNGPIDHVRLTFSEAIDDGTFTTGDVIELVGPSGVVNPTHVQMVSPTVFDVVFASQSELGSYFLSLGPNIEDLAGNPMNQDGDGTNGEATDDRFETEFAIGMAFDFGTTTSPVDDGYTQVASTTTYNAVDGYGWQTGTVGERDRAVGDDLERDLNFTRLATFAVDVDNGDYEVTITAGDAGPYAHDAMGFLLEGTLVDTLSTARGEVVTHTYFVTVTDGQLTLQLDDLGGSDAYVVINGLTLVPVVTAGPLAAKPLSAERVDTAFAEWQDLEEDLGLMAFMDEL